MLRKKLFLTLATAWLLSVTANGQTDCTQFITNPSFEQGTKGWEHNGMSEQNNSVFSIKDGNVYMERWTGRNGAVGSGRLAQELRNLPPGNYTLTAAAQNIQEDTPKAEQTGAWIFVTPQVSNAHLQILKSQLKKTPVTVRDTYAVDFNFVAGSVTIGFEAKDASGNWIATDNFKLTLVGTDLSAELEKAIEEAAKYDNTAGKEYQQLEDAIASARTVAAKADATAEEQAEAIMAMEKAVDRYLRANATAENPLDMTERITNPSFENGDMTGWTATEMGVMSNDFFSQMKGTWYVEKWTGRGAHVGDASITQKLTDMPAGRYRLHAAAQNIQEDSPKAEQTGAWIFAGTYNKPISLCNNYSLEFVQVADELEIGFEAKGATGNWIAVDNFRLEYIGDNFDEIKDQFASLVASAEALADKRMNSEAKKTLDAAIATATPLLLQTTTDGWPAAATELQNAIAAAVASCDVFNRLAYAIAAAKTEIDSNPTADITAYQSAVDAAQAVYDAETTTDAQAETAIKALDEASFAFKVLNGSGSGTAPEVTTDTRFVRGATWAFGRSTVKGADIIETGFCWAENPDPKVTDNRTTEYLNQEGRIYWLRDLKPATMYYMRAYAISKDYAVGYGDVIKFATVPKGTIGHWYNNGGDEATNDRINYAINTSMDYYWNNLTSIHGFGISVTYSPGTPTADCSYGGSMRVGASSSYQQPGTIMHEALHGIGVGTHNMWWSADMRSAGNRGDWLGDRVTEAVRFWDNSPTAVITGDDMHLWPYGCNGAHEDSHSDNLYCMMGILAQALNEDGLPGSGEIGYALPYYAFNHEDSVKYYIKNEDENRGLRSAYLVENESHQLQWKTMSAEEAAADDAAAWYLSFTPSNQYYQLRNAASGYYITYSSGIKTANRTKATTADNFHLMRGRVNVDGHRGYYIIHPETSATPHVLNAIANGKTATAQWNIALTAKSQRWLILTAEEALQFDNGNIDLAKAELAELLNRIRTLARTPHQENVEGADVNLDSQLSDIERMADACTKGIEVNALIEQARNAAVTFLSSVSATDEAQPFNLTFMLENPDFDSDATTGWVSTNGTPGYDAQSAEFYEKTFDFYQILDNMPSGNYRLHANAFQRPGTYDAILAPYSKGTAKVTTSLYINSTAKPVKHICDDRQPTALFNDGGWGSDKKLADDTYIPNCMTGAGKYFAKGYYDSSVDANLETAGASLRVGIKCTNAPTAYWTMFDHFQLHFFGGYTGADGIRETEQGKHDLEHAIYDLQGRRMNNFHYPSTTTRQPFQKGIYIVNGKKAIIK
jgi:hypothetical protein